MADGSFARLGRRNEDSNTISPTEYSHSQLPDGQKTRTNTEYYSHLVVNTRPKHGPLVVDMPLRVLVQTLEVPWPLGPSPGLNASGWSVCRTGTSNGEERGTDLLFLAVAVAVRPALGLSILGQHPE